MLSTARSPQLAGPRVAVGASAGVFEAPGGSAPEPSDSSGGILVSYTASAERPTPGSPDI